jgi:hypothetical protein
MPQRKYKNRNSEKTPNRLEKMRFNKSHEGNNLKKEIPTKPLVAKWIRS